MSLFKRKKKSDLEDSVEESAALFNNEDPGYGVYFENKDSYKSFLADIQNKTGMKPNEIEEIINKHAVGFKIVY